MLIVNIGLDVKYKYRSQDMSSEIVKVFMDENINSSVILRGIVACAPGEIESTPTQLS